MDDGQIPMDLLYWELGQGKSLIGRPQLCYNDICKKDLKALNKWEAVVSKWRLWRVTISEGLSKREEMLAQQSKMKRMRRSNEAQSQTDRPGLVFACAEWGRECKSRIGLPRHTRRCTSSIRDSWMPIRKNKNIFYRINPLKLQYNWAKSERTTWPNTVAADRLKTSLQLPTKWWH